MAAELRLNVSLDLGFFRQQLQKLTVVAQSEFAPKLNVKFDRATLGKELKALTKVLDKAVVLKVSDSQLEGARLRLSKLNKSIALFRRANEQAIQIKIKYVEEGKAPTGTIAKSGTFRQRLEKTESESIKQLYKAAGEAGIVEFSSAISGNRGKIITALNQAGEDSVTGLINGLKSKDAAVKSAAKSMGDVLIAALKMSLQIQSPSKKMEAIGEDSGAGFSKGLTESLADAKDAAVVKMRQLVAALRFEAAKVQGVFPGAGGLGAGTGRLSALRTQESRLSGQVGRLSGASGMMQGTRGVVPAGARQALAGATANLPSVQSSLRTVRGQIIDELFSAASSKGEISSSVARNVSNDIGRGISSALSPAIARTSTGAVRGRIPTAGMARREVAAGPMGIFEPSTLSLTATEYLNDARRVLGLPMGPVSSYAANPWAGSASVPPTATAAPSRLLPPAGATSNYGVAAQAQAMAQATQQYGFMRAPSVPPSMARSSPGGPPGAPPGSPPGGGGGRGAGFFGGMQFNIPELPGSGVMQELGQEFGFAAKQVLLFGTAYKALAFIQTFPAQVGEAVGALQSFRNTIGEISPTAKEAGASSQFILDIVEKYNVPLQSARDGFVKLYASMQPAGFSGDEIRDLFLGISQTAATFGMSADKVDRVNYAFAQMASKGQVMSEELKGQLGDVLPGAMAIFAEAAGFKGPEAISKFSEALEDGVYKGGAMKTLLTNVGGIMRKEFGPGAEGAARTFQGVMNRLQNSTKLLYESFEPVAVGFLNAVVMPMTNGIKTITDGFNAFFTGTAAKTSGGFAFAQELEKLRPSFEGIAQNVKELLPLLQTFGSVLLNVGKFFAVIAGNPITGFLLKLYGNILLVNTVFNLLGGRILVNLITSLGASISRFIALNIAMASMQRTSAVTNSTLAGTQLQMALLTRNASAAIGPVSLLKNALIGLARIGLIAIAINVVINGMAEIDRLKKSLADIGTFSSAGYRKEISAMSKEDVNSRLITNRATQKQIKEELKQYQGIGGSARGIVTGRDEELRGRLVTVQSKEQELIRANRSAKTQVQLSSSVTGAGLAPIPLTGGDGKPRGGKGGGKGEKAAENLREEIERQAQAASNALFSEKQRLLVLQQTNPIAKAFVEYTNQEANITRQLNVDLKEAKGDAEKKDLIEKAGIERKINERNLEEEINQARKNSLEPIENILKGQREKLQYEEEYKELLAKKINPEVAKQMLEVRQIVRAQLEALDLSIKNASAAITEAEARGASAEAVKKLRDELAGLEKDRADAAGKGEAAEGGVPQGAEKTDGQKITDRIGALKQEIQELTSLSNIAIQSADGIGTAFGEAFAGLISGSVTAQEALGNFFKSVGDMFIQMATEIIAKQMTMIILQTILKALGAVAGGGGGGGASTGFGSGFDQLGGANFGGGGNVTGFFGANGGIAAGGWQPFPVTAFANGGMVTGPTLGLVGEGKYNEAIVPLPNGRSIPVQLQGDESVRNKMDRDRYNNGGGASVLNMSFETTEIGGVEYVSRDQLEQAMAETRRNATRDGAQRGMSMTLDRIQNSSSTRRRIGV